MAIQVRGFALRIPHESPFFYLIAVTLVSSLLLGGGSPSGLVSDALLQALVIPLLVISLWRLWDLPASRDRALGLYFGLACVALPALQLLPLPPFLWSNLPGRAPAVEAFTLSGQALPWMPLSLSAQLTWLSALSLLPPAAIFCATLLLSNRERRRLTLVLLAFGAVSVFLGLLQLAQGQGSPLRFFSFTNVQDAVGFFANRNHFSALLYCLVVLAAAWLMDAVTRVQEMRSEGKVYDTAVFLILLSCVIVLVMLVVAQTMTRSRAGLGLTVVALAGASGFALSRPRAGSWFTPRRVLAAVLLAAVLMSIQFAFQGVIGRFAGDPVEDARVPFARNTLEAAWAHMPFGSGLGTFVPVYAAFEKPGDLIPNVYANHAHNDVLEFWLETGIFGMLLFAAFGFWFVLRVVALWRPGAKWSVADIDLSLARGATLIVGLLFAHSFVDYPLRTSALMSVAAFAVAFLIAPPPGEAPEPARTKPAAKRASGPDPKRQGGTSPSGKRPPAPAPRPSTPSGGWQRPNIDWPEAWQPAPDSGTPKEKINKLPPEGAS